MNEIQNGVKNKKGDTVTVVLIIVLLILLIASMSFTVYDKFIKKDNTVNNQQTEEKDNTKNDSQIENKDDLIVNGEKYELIDINTFVELCYKVVGTPLEKIYVANHSNQRDYFSFHDYEYSLDVTKQSELLMEEKDLFEGLKESYEWFKDNYNEVSKKDYIKYIEENFK